MSKLDLDTLHDYVVAQGYGSPTLPAFKLAKAMWRTGTHDYATIANEVVYRGFVVGAQLDKAVNRQLVECAAQLFGDGEGNELGDNTEYERGIVELICEYIELGFEHTDEVREAIHEEARMRAAV